MSAFSAGAGGGAVRGSTDSATDDSVPCVCILVAFVAFVVMASLLQIARI
jgi:hypothetical protein